MVVVAGHCQAIQPAPLQTVKNYIDSLIDQVSRKQKRGCFHPVLLNWRPMADVARDEILTRVVAFGKTSIHPQ
jgi:hypothetical protein